MNRPLSDFLAWKYSQLNSSNFPISRGILVLERTSAPNGTAGRPGRSEGSSIYSYPLPSSDRTAVF